jgi:F0F1-type ATP synthase alpha subunit
MANIILYISKISNLKKNVFFGCIRVGIIKNNSSIPVIVVDLQTNKSIKYTSINQAARSLAAHPKTI